MSIPLSANETSHSAVVSTKQSAPIHSRAPVANVTDSFSAVPLSDRIASSASHSAKASSATVTIPHTTNEAFSSTKETTIKESKTVPTTTAAALTKVTTTTTTTKAKLTTTSAPTMAPSTDDSDAAPTTTLWVGYPFISQIALLTLTLTSFGLINSSQESRFWADVHVSQPTGVYAPSSVQQLSLAALNALRAQHSAPDLTWNITLQEIAQTVVDPCAWTDDGFAGVGTSLAGHWGPGAAAATATDQIAVRRGCASNASGSRNHH